MLERLLDGVERIGHWILLSHPDLMAQMRAPETSPGQDLPHDPLYWPFVV